MNYPRKVEKKGKRMGWEELTPPIVKYTRKIEKKESSGIGSRIENYINETQLRIQKQIWFAYKNVVYDQSGTSN